ncbi:putative metalloreductase fre8 protein [Naviculisporaceae sp. PSN 640]
MSWPFEFQDLSPGDKQLRRQELDRYAGYAQLSVFLPLAVGILHKLVTSWASRSRRDVYSAIPNYNKSQRSGELSPRLRKLSWWLGEDVVAFGKSWGQRDQWIGGAFWGLWLLLLCVLDTHRDYLHVTKRFGIVAASQYPIQYLLALKSLNPFAYVFRSSHERVNRWHRVLGIVIYTFICLHVIFYFNFFVQTGILAQRLQAPVVIFGVVAFWALTLLNTTAVHQVRHYSYRLFFLTHLLVAFVMPPLLFFHALPAKWFMAEALIVFIADLASRKMDTVVSHATLETIPGTNLVKITASIPHTKVNRFRVHPGAHIYLNLPAPARGADPTSSAHLLFEFLFNPFTVAAVDEDNGDLTLVARHRGGPMTAALGRLARATGTSSGPDASKFPLAIEGPYGVFTHAAALTSGEFDRILLVSGGIGATFTLPLYRAIINDNPSAKVELIWAIQTAGDATWAVMGTSSHDIMNDENVHIFITGQIGDSSSSAGAFGRGQRASISNSHSRSRRSDSVGEGSGLDEGNGEVEMSAMYRDRRKNKYTSQHNRKRPDLRKIVDDMFKNAGLDEKVAVVVCGPEEMSADLRRQQQQDHGKSKTKSRSGTPVVQYTTNKRRKQATLPR